MKIILCLLTALLISGPALAQTIPFNVVDPSGISRFGVNNANVSVLGDVHPSVALAVGYNSNRLISNHQVGVYVPLLGNAYTGGSYGYVIGYETALGTASGNYHPSRVVSFLVGGIAKGAGTSIGQTIGLVTEDETVGDANASIADFNNTFTGNWFINYAGTRASHLNGDLILGDNNNVPILRFAAYYPYTSEGVIYRSGNNLLIATTGIGTRVSIDLGTGAVSIPGLGYGGGTLSVSPSDSGGTGYRMVRVPN
jgi:hypothetical protein